MIALRNKSATSTPISLPIGTTVVPFDTLICNTNSATSWNASINAIDMVSPGRYNARCTAVVSCTAGGTATLQLMANGMALPGYSVEASIEASGAVPMILALPITVERSAGSDAYLQWAITVSAASTLDNALADVQGIR